MGRLILLSDLLIYCTDEGSKYKLHAMLKLVERASSMEDAPSWARPSPPLRQPPPRHGAHAFVAVCRHDSYNLRLEPAAVFCVHARACRERGRHVAVAVGWRVAGWALSHTQFAHDGPQPNTECVRPSTTGLLAQGLTASCFERAWEDLTDVQQRSAKIAGHAKERWPPEKGTERHVLLILSKYKSFYVCAAESPFSLAFCMGRAHGRPQ